MEGYVDRLRELNEYLEKAEKLLWERVQMGNFDGPASAVASMKAYEYITKAEKIIADNLSQLPLPLVDKTTGEIRH